MCLIIKIANNYPFYNSTLMWIWNELRLQTLFILRISLRDVKIFHLRIILLFLLQTSVYLCLCSGLVNIHLILIITVHLTWSYFCYMWTSKIVFFSNLQCVKFLLHLSLFLFEGFSFFVGYILNYFSVLWLELISFIYSNNWNQSSPLPM